MGIFGLEVRLVYTVFTGQPELLVSLKKEMKERKKEERKRKKKSYIAGGGIPLLCSKKR